MHLFYQPDDSAFYITGAEAQHCIRVLRLEAGEDIVVVNGRGGSVLAGITRAVRDRVEFTKKRVLTGHVRPYRIHIAISPTRKTDRNDWMVEKMVELGVDAISFVRTEHSHKESFGRMVNLERMEKLAVAAMKQSRQSVLPVFKVWDGFEELVRASIELDRFIAYVEEERPPAHLISQVGAGDVMVMIGPEGDFSGQELSLAMGAGFRTVSLGSTRLRTETAAVAACHAVHLAQLLKEKGSEN